MNLDRVASAINRDYYKLAPFLIGTYSVLFLVAANQGEDIQASEAISIVVAIWGLSLLAWASLIFLARDRQSIPLLLTVGSIAFFTYGHLLEGAREAEVFHSQQILLAAHFFPTVITLLAVWFRRVRGITFLKTLTFVLGALILMNAVTLLNGTTSTSSYEPNEELISKVLVSAGDPEQKPDIYLFIMDMYGSSRALSEYAHFDNTAFITEMESLGFIELSESRSNYMWTGLSIPSTLNLELLDSGSPGNSVASEDYRKSLLTRDVDVSDTNVGQIFQGIGYETNSLHTSEVAVKSSLVLWNMLLSPFSDQFIKSTLLRPARTKLNNWWQFGFGQHNFRENFRAENIQNSSEQPTFTYIYSWPPHMPFIFESNGDIRGGAISTNSIFNDQDLHRAGYKDSLSFVNGTIGEVITLILENSSVPPIILIQSDHGSGISPNADFSEVSEPTPIIVDERSSIINLMLLPESCSTPPPNDLMSVNTFRFVFASCFGASIDLLPNDIFWGDSEGSLERVTDMIPAP